MQSPGLSYNALHREGGGGGMVHGKTKTERERGQKWNEIRREEEETGGDVGGRKRLIGSPQRFFCLDCSAFHFFHSPPPPSSFLTSEVHYNRDPGSHLWLKSRTYAVCVCERESVHMFVWLFQCSGIPLWSSSGGQIYFLVHCLSLGLQRTIVCWPARVLQVTCRSWTTALFLSYTSSLIPFYKTLTLSAQNQNLKCIKCGGSALLQKVCLGFEQWSVVVPHFFHLGLDEPCCNIPQSLQKLL